MDDAGTLQFNGLFRRWRTTVADVRRIRRRQGWDSGYRVSVRFDGGWAILIGSGDSELVDRVLAQNPTIKLNGKRFKDGPELTPFG